MNIIDLATKTMQTAIKGVVDAIKVTTDNTKTKVDTIDVNVGTLLNGRVVKSVQRGVVVLGIGGSGSPTTITVPISAINISKSDISVYGGVSYSGTNGAVRLPFVEAVTATSITISNNGAVLSNTDGRVSWQVVEYY